MSQKTTRFMRALRGPMSRVAVLVMIAAFATAPSLAQLKEGYFNRVATFPIVFNTCADNLEDQECFGLETVAEIAAATEDGMTVVYTDSQLEAVGFVDIADPSDPQAGGIVELTGEPTSVAVAGDYALVSVNTSESFTNPSGHLTVVGITSREIITTIDLGGQPDAIDVSPDRRYAAVAIENERNEDACAGGTLDGMEVDEDECEAGGGVLGGLPQLPAGNVVIVDLVGAPTSWTTRTVTLAGVPDKFPTDPEPEFIKINAANICAVTMQENNHIALIHLPSGAVQADFPLRDVDLTRIDTIENGVIELDSSLDDVPREPDAVAWISNVQLATADEGDLEGGSRGFTIFGKLGNILHTSGNSVEHITARVGHYPEERSENKGSEPEGIAFAEYGTDQVLFVGSERSSVVLVYRLRSNAPPEFVQVLPAGLGPEGLLPIPSRNLLVASSEEDSREDTFRASLSIYELGASSPDYPTVMSANRPDGTPIPWGALSALAAHRTDPDIAYTTYDSFYGRSRIFPLDVSSAPAVITGEIVLRDVFGNTFDLDPEGLAVRSAADGGGFWLVSEGSGTCAAPGDCANISRLNHLIAVSPSGLVTGTVLLPAEVNDVQRNNGFEGVTTIGSGTEEMVYVAFQREWLDDPEGMVRIGRYQPSTGDWTFYHYPLDAVESPNSGWIGLSEITAIDAERLAILERDNQAGPDARVKRIYEVTIAGVDPQPQGETFPVLEKRLVRDILPDLASANGLVIEKVEGVSLQADGDVLIVTDNDGTDDSSGETQLQNLGRIF